MLRGGLRPSKDGGKSCYFLVALPLLLRGTGRSGETTEDMQPTLSSLLACVCECPFLLVLK